MTSFLLQFGFPPPASVLVSAMSVISLGSLANAGLSEIRGKHLQYSKFFWKMSSEKKKAGEAEDKKVSSRTGMLVLYTPSFLAGLFSLGLFPYDGIRFMLVDAALTLHFFKRVFEVLFVHKYSGGMALESVIPISLSYFLSTATMIYNQHLMQGVPEPQVDLKFVGAVVFLLGIGGNLYHHLLLAKLREKDSEGYKIPKGGMFNLVVCPHYLFEILAFVGISLMSQTVYSVCFTLGTIFYLVGRSYMTRDWYLSKFPNFPKEVKCLVPFLF